MPRDAAAVATSGPGAGWLRPSDRHGGSQRYRRRDGRPPACTRSRSAWSTAMFSAPVRGRSSTIRCQRIPSRPTRPARTPAPAPGCRPSSDAAHRLVRLDRRARADQIAVAGYVVDPPDRRPELVHPRPRRRESGFLPGIWTTPLVRRHRLRGVRRVLERVVRLVEPLFLDPADLLADP